AYGLDLPNAIDPDDDALTYSIESGPGGLLINAESGALLWAASPDQVGVHDVTIVADDGRGGRATQSFKIEVEPARENSAPIIASTSVEQIGANEAFSYTVEAIDSDRHALRYRLLDGPAGSVLDPVTGELTWDTRHDAALSTHVPYSRTGGVRVPASESFESPSITVEGWFQWDQLPAGNGADYLFHQENDLGVAYALQNRFNNRLRFDANLPGGNERFEIPFQFEADRWYHFAITIDDSTNEVAVYADGQQLATFTLSESIEFSGRNVEVHDTFFQFQGATDNYRIWNVARSPQQIEDGLAHQYENEPTLVLDYRFGSKSSKSVLDYSGNENHGYRISNGESPGLVDGLADPGPKQFRISVEDGRGGYDEQSFTLNVRPELRGSIIGYLFDDLNGNGIQDDGSDPEVPAEPNLVDWHLFIDVNANGFPDPQEAQTVTDADGNYEFTGLLPGSYPVRVSPVAGYMTPDGFDALAEPRIKRELDPSSVDDYDLAIEQLSLSQIRGQLISEDGDAIAYWKAYADLNGDGVRGEDDPMAMSDRDGNYAISGLAAGDYTIRAELPAGWADAAGPDGLAVSLAVDEVSSGNDFTLRPTNTSVTGGLHFVTTAATQIEARQTLTYASVAMGVTESETSYELSLAPEGMVIDANTGLVAWRPTIDQVGEHLVILRATDATGSIALQDFYVTVSAPNTAPVIVLPSREAIASQLSGDSSSDTERHGASRRFFSAYVGLNYSHDVVAQDAEGSELSYALVQAPAGATIHPNSGRIQWTPSAGEMGLQLFTVKVTDSDWAADQVTWLVDVMDAVPDVLPLEMTYPRLTAAVSAEYFSRIEGSDALGRPLKWSLSTGPVGFSIATDGTIQWTPSNSQLGAHSIELTATTADGASESVQLDLEVLGRALSLTPVIESEPPTSVALGKDLEYDLLVADADQDIHAFTLLDGPVGMSVHPSRGFVQWNPGEDQLGEHDVLIQVSDPTGNTAEQSFTLKASRFGGPPRIVSIPPTTAAVGSGFLYTVEAIDREGDPLTYSLLAAPTGMTITENTGEIAWTPSVGQVGDQDVVIQVSDGVGGATTQAFSINVAAGAMNLPPQITSTAPRFGAVGTEYSYAFAAKDPESGTITYSLSRAPVAMSIDSDTGLVTWNPAAGDEGKHVVTLVATDEGGAVAVESFELDVLAQNTLPVINGTPPLEATAGALFHYDLLASDADLDPLTFELVSAPADAEIDAFGRIRMQTILGDIGPKSFAVLVTDARGGQATQNFTTQFVADTEPPKLSLIENLGDTSRNVQPWQGPFVVYAKAIDNVEVASLTLQANGQDIPLDAAGTASFAFEDWFFATINATATAIDTSGNVTTRTITFNYDVPEGWSTNPGPEVPTAIITSPADNGTAFGMVSITGTAEHEDFGAYTLSYRRADETSFTEILRSTNPVVNGELGVWDTSLLRNDEYVIRLQVATTTGTANVVEHSVGLAGELKLGNFRLSFTDMVIPVAGIPIEITRIYDTLDANIEGDFGFGWRLEYRNTDLRVGLPKSGLEDIGIYSALRPGVKVFLNVPGEGRQGFTFNPDIRVLPGWGGNNLVLARPRFTPDRGVTSTLGTGTSSYLQVNERGELYAPGGIPYNPASPDFGGAYVLTTSNDMNYRIDGSTGELISATDAKGNQVRFAEDGIETIAGKIEIESDTTGRITSITDFDGISVDYRYDNSGRLSEVFDREGNSTKFVYDPANGDRLIEVIDALGRTGQR
ncbi:MAG: putative Ig domain-containing protein, partial [Planctomycetota bacterium]